MSTTAVIVLLIVIAILLASGIVILLRRRTPDPWQTSATLLQQLIRDSAMQQDNQLSNLSRQLTDSLQKLSVSVQDRMAQEQSLAQQTQSAIAQRLDTAGKTIAALHEQMGKLHQSTQQIQQFSAEVRQLQDILQSPKLRGGLGEWSLENLLADVLPQNHYQIQYRFPDGGIVDAVVELIQGRVCIDAKFPLENFQAMLQAENPADRAKARRNFLRDVRKRIDEIAQKYIQPDQGTLDFAMMYVPAENVYYETLLPAADEPADIASYGRGKKVILVSPNTLYAYLMVIAAGLRGLQIEQNAKQIRQRLAQLQTELQLFLDDFLTVGKHIGNAKARFDDAARKIDNFNFRLRQLDGNTDPTDPS